MLQLLLNMAQRLGKYSVNQSGRAMKLTIPAEIVEKWKLKNKDEVFIYVDQMDDDLTLIVSKNPLKGDILGD